MNRTLIVLSVLIIPLFLSNCKPEELSRADRLARDVALIDQYLEENNITAMVDPSGLRYVIHEQGTGATPTINSTITITYVAKFMDSGQVFDENPNGLVHPLAGFVNAWHIGVPLIQAGGAITLYAPSVLCYGKNGFNTGGIPPDANLIFEIHLIATT